MVPATTDVSRNSDSVRSENDLAPCILDQRQSKGRQCRTMAVLRIVGEWLFGKQLSDDVGIDGFVGVHGPRVQLREANGQSDERDDEESQPASPTRTRARILH